MTIARRKATRLKSNPLFWIKPKKSFDGLSTRKAYPVFSIDVEDIGVPVVGGSLAKVTTEERQKIEETFDSDDIELMEEKMAKTEKEAMVITWLLIGVEDKKKLMWVDASKVRYITTI